MKFCRFATSTDSPCSDGFSRKVLCAHDMIVKCLRDCSRGCSRHEPIDEEFLSNPGKTNVPVSSQLTPEQQKEFDEHKKQMQTNMQKNRPSGGCGGCGGNPSTNDTKSGGGWTKAGIHW